MAPKPPTPQGISALLRRAGFGRAEKRSRRGLNRARRAPAPRTEEGYEVHSFGGSSVYVWHMGATRAAAEEMFSRYAEVITAAGYRAEVDRDEGHLTVTAREN